MTEDLIAMAQLADCTHVNLNGDRAAAVERLTRFAALIEARAVARTREECAKVRAVGCVLHAANSNMALNSSFEDRQILGLENIPLYEPERITLVYAAIRALGERT